jgi:hypothetical protein
MSKMRKGLWEIPEGRRRGRKTGVSLLRGEETWKNYLRVFFFERWNVDFFLWPHRRIFEIYLRLTNTGGPPVIIFPDQHLSWRIYFSALSAFPDRLVWSSGAMYGHKVVRFIQAFSRLLCTPHPDMSFQCYQGYFQVPGCIKGEKAKTETEANKCRFPLMDDPIIR